MILIKPKIVFCTLFASFIFIWPCLKAQVSQKPNIIFILADDLGYGDLKAYNEESLIPTPHLDQLAEESIQLTNAYCPAAVCTPTRYALMTGNYPFRSSNKRGVLGNYEPSLMTQEQVTLPEMLQNSGYTTAGFGKWHLGTTFPTLDGKKPAGYGQFRADDNGANLDLSKPVSDGPMDHGFDHWLGFSCASECWIFEDRMVTAAFLHDFYTTEAAKNKDHIQYYELEEYLPYITDESISYLKQHTSSQNKKPFFLYFSPYVPHIPLAVNEEFRGKTEAGLYGDYVHELDYHIGRILNTLDELGLMENTIIFFASDNGSHFSVAADELPMEEAVNSPFEVDENIEIDQIHYPNGHLRGTKRDAWEGGVRTPFLARWPGHFPAGEKNAALFSLNDMMATLAALLDYDIPTHSAKDSYNLLSVLEGKDNGLRNSVVVQSSGATYGLRWNQWKYIAEPESENSASPGQLYDLAEDESETTNLYTQRPEMVESMKKKLAEIMESKESNE
jgi:arylsulfatase A-like enzyme